MTQEFLRHLHINTHCPKIRHKRMPKVVPADLLVDDACPFQGWLDAYLQEAVRAKWLSTA